MCIVSMVHDHYDPLIPLPEDIFPGTVLPHQPPSFDWTTLLKPGVDLAELRQLIADFRECVAAAQRLDVAMKQPDCVDPEKAKLEERCARLEKIIDALLVQKAAP